MSINNPTFHVDIVRDSKWKSDKYDSFVEAFITDNLLRLIFRINKYIDQTDIIKN